MIDLEASLATCSILLHITIRPAEATDIPLLEWYGEFHHYRNVFRQAYEDQLSGRRLILVADSGGFPVGRLFVQLAASHPAYANGIDRAYLYSLHVMAPLQGRGIGTRLIRAAERVLLDEGYTWATIAAAKHNPRARGLYERLGYVFFREDAGNWSYTDPDGQKQYVSEPCWVLEKRLQPGSSRG